jgi:MFS family permease
MTTNTHEELTFCAVHPDRETGLRCNKCGRYMCVQCAVSTPVGYRCRECVRKVDDKFFTGTNNDYVVTGVMCGLTGLAVGFATTKFVLPILLALFGGVIIGNLLGTFALRFTEKRRGRYSAQIGAASVGAGGVIGAFLGGYNLVYLSFGFSGVGFSAPIFIGIIALMVYRRFELK